MKQATKDHLLSCIGSAVKIYLHAHLITSTISFKYLLITMLTMHQQVLLT